MNLDDLRSLYDFTDRTVLVTGGAGVLGFGINCPYTCHRAMILPPAADLTPANLANNEAVPGEYASGDYFVSLPEPPTVIVCFNELMTI